MTRYTIDIDGDSQTIKAHSLDDALRSFCSEHAADLADQFHADVTADGETVRVKVQREMVMDVRWRHEVRR